MENDEKEKKKSKDKEKKTVLVEHCHLVLDPFRFSGWMTMDDRRTDGTESPRARATVGRRSVPLGQGFPRLAGWPQDRSKSRDDKKKDKDRLEKRAGSRMRAHGVRS